MLQVKGLKAQMGYCTKCGKQLSDSEKFCGACGARNASLDVTGKDFAVRKCPGCGEILDSFTETCPSCGFRFAEKNQETGIRKVLKDGKDYFLQFGNAGKIAWLILLFVGIPAACVAYFFLALLVAALIAMNISSYEVRRIVLLVAVLSGPIALLVWHLIRTRKR